jgi:hypothetical protein
VQRVAPKLPLLLSNAFKLMCLFCAPGTHDQKCTAVSFISTCYFAKVVANTLCDVGFAPRGLRFRMTRILEIGVPMTRDSVESWIKSHILSNGQTPKDYFLAINLCCPRTRTVNSNIFLWLCLNILHWNLSNTT